MLIGAIPGPGIKSHPGSARQFRPFTAGSRNILATTMLSIAQTNRIKADSGTDTPAASDKWHSRQGASFTEFLPPNGTASRVVNLCIEPVIPHLQERSLDCRRDTGALVKHWPLSSHIFREW